MSARTRELVVFAHLPKADAPGFVPAGKLRLTQTPGSRGSDLASQFGYGVHYVERPEAFEVDPVSLPFPVPPEKRGRYVFPAKGLAEFGGIRDAAPDAWGRRVIEARRKVPSNSLDEADYLLDAGSDRVGALDVRLKHESPSQPSASDLRTLEYVLQAAEAVERGEFVPARLADLLAAGSSAGGARPKASVRDADGVLWLAKFPSRTDTFDVARAELCTLELARRCGLTVPALQHLDIGRRSVMLIERFDRRWAPPARSKETAETSPQAVELRVPFVSGLTLMGVSEQESRVSSYAGLALAMRAHQHPGRIRSDREELFTRMIFNIFVSNDDDHLRNHGFLRSLALGGWTLSPLYDVVPRPGVAHERFLHLEVGAQGKLATLDNALSQWQAFVGSRPRAVQLMHRVWRQLREWRNTFEEFGATGQLLDQLAPAMRELEDIASPALQAEIRRGAPSGGPHERLDSVDDPGERPDVETP